MTTIGDILAPDLGAIEADATAALAGTKAVLDLPPLTNRRCSASLRADQATRPDHHWRSAEVRLDHRPCLAARGR